MTPQLFAALNAALDSGAAVDDVPSEAMAELGQGLIDAGWGVTTNIADPTFIRLVHPDGRHFTMREAT